MTSTDIDFTMGDDALLKRVSLLERLAYALATNTSGGQHRGCVDRTDLGSVSVCQAYVLSTLPPFDRFFDLLFRYDCRIEYSNASPDGELVLYVPRNNGVRSVIGSSVHYVP
jgi:hypothetical protein